jgi:hypothetical protein
MPAVSDVEVENKQLAIFAGLNERFVRNSCLDSLLLLTGDPRFRSVKPWP